MTHDLQDLLRHHLSDPACGISVGGFGALAEFQDDAVVVQQPGTGAIVARSARGAVRIAPTGAERVLAYETLSARDDAWQCGVGILGEPQRCGMAARAVLTELEADDDPLFEQERGLVRFDLGAGLDNVDFCIRTGDRELIAVLRAHAGEAVIADGHPVMEAVIDASPTRVVCSSIARVEVRQRIDRHRTPSGPHTHLLPGLLASRRTHSANIPFPRDTLPLVMLHPENPLSDAAGGARRFKRDAHERFQNVLAAFGDPTYVAEKRRLGAAIGSGMDPAAYTPARSRIGRLAQRVALRQLSHDGVDAERLSRWRAHLRHPAG